MSVVFVLWLHGICNSQRAQLMRPYFRTKFVFALCSIFYVLKILNWYLTPSVAALLVPLSSLRSAEGQN